MSMKKLSFSLMLALFLVGMLSTAAFAKDPFGLKAVQVGSDITVTFNGVTEDVGGTTVFVLFVKDETGVIQTKAVTIDGSKKGSQVLTGLKPGIAYDLELTRQIDPTTIVSSANIMVTDSSNALLGVEDVDQDTNLTNANQTGFNVLSKRISGQKMHGAYQNNTNSCASCHQTHTGEDHYLLFRDGTYSTCAACHDGTMGAKGVFSEPSNAGTFGGTHDGNMSIHLSDGTVSVKAAPGGNASATSGKWTEEFSCASCHNPHGSESTKLLLADPAGWIKTENAVTAGKTNGGMKFTDRQIYDKSALPTSNVSDYIIVRQILGTQAQVDANVFFKREAVPVGSTVISTYRWDGKAKKYVEDSSLWMRSDGGRPAVETQLKVGTAAQKATTNFVIIYKDGFAYSKPGDTTVAAIDKATFLIGSSIEKVSNNYDYFDSASPTYVKDSGVQMSKFCASCHTDYLSATYANETGVFTTAHRHQTDTDRLTCVRCHYAHGTDASIMKDSLDRGVAELTAVGGKFAGDTSAALSYLKDPNPSSALKRYTGMAVCFGCHDGSIASDEATWSNYSPLQPGAFKP